MKVLVVQETDWLKRNPHQQHHLAEMLSLRGHDIRVIDYEFSWKTETRRHLFSRRQVFDNAHKVRDGARIMVIRPGIIKLPFLDYVSLVFSHKREIDRQIEEFAPDIIIGFGILNTYLAMRAARRGGIPFVYYWIDVLHTLVPTKAFQPIARIVEGRTLRHADRVLVINERLKEHVVAMGAAPGQTHVVGAGIDIERFDPATDGKPIREQFGIEKEDTVLFFMGWLYQFSGLKEVAMQLAIVGNPHIRLLVVGEGDAFGELERIRQAQGLQERIILTGKRPYNEIPAFVAASDICLLPAYPHEEIMQDIVPIKVYEYMAMRKPVVSTRLPGIVREFGEDNGVVYVDKPEDVVAKAIELVRDRSVERHGSRARGFVERYSWESITDEFEGILEKVIEEKRNERISKRI